jgi:hypothetical protein
VLAAVVIGVPFASAAVTDAPAPPTIGPASEPANPTNQTDASFEFSDEDASATFECQLDGGGFSACASPAVYSGLADGSHTFEVRAVDPAMSDPSDVAPYTWTIDATPPPVPTIGPHATLEGSSTTSFTFSSEGATSFECNVDGAAFTACSSGDSFGPFPDGLHTFFVRALDEHGNASDAASFPWTIDTTPPPVPTIGPHASLEGSTTTSFTFSSEGAASFECHVDGAAFTPCSSGNSFGPFSEGLHTFFVRALDGLGNASLAASSQWTIDTIAPPAPQITAEPQDPSGSSSATFSFTDADPTVAFKCKRDGEPFSDCSSKSVTYTGLLDGSHTFGVKAIDPIGHQSQLTTYTWTIDTVHPVVTLTDKPPLVTNQTTATFSFSSTRPSSTYQCKLDDGSLASCASPKIYSSLHDGQHTFSVQATSLANTGPTTEFTWTVDTVAPDTTIGSTPPATSNTPTATFAFTSTEPGSTFACSLGTAGFTPCASPQSYAGLGDGAHTFRVQAVDAAGNVDASPASYSWQIVGVGPETIDHTPPGNVRRLRRNVGYGVLYLTWRKPGDGDFDHVKVFVSTSAKSAPRTPVYTGHGTKYTKKHFKNGLYYRFAVVSYDRSGNASRGVPVTVPASILLRRPRDGGLVRSPPRLLWDELINSTFYNVQLYYGAQKVLSAWPNHAKLKLGRRWSYGGRHFQLRKGLYHWYVWPGFGPRAKGRYGQLLGQATFRVR